MFGFLRRLIMSGDIKGLLDGSRRALREFSPEFGERVGRGGPEGAYDFLRRRGVDVSQYDDAIDPMNMTVYPSPTAGGGFGRTVYDADSGSRFMAPPQMYSPIVSPYEGGRAWPMFRDELGYQFPAADRVPPWVGRGPAPTPDFANPYDDGFAGSMPSYAPESWAYPGGLPDYSVPSALRARPWDVRRMQPPPPFRVNGGAIQYESPGVYIDPSTGYRYDQYGFMLDGR